MKTSFFRPARRVVSIVLLLFFAVLGHGQNQTARERNLSKRVDELYRLFVSGEWRKVEPFVSGATRDLWVAQPKGTIDSYQIKEIKVDPDGKRADVTVMATFHIPQIDAPFTQPQVSEWVYEKGKWFLKVKPRPTALDMFKASGAPSNTAVGQAKFPLVLDQNPIRFAPGETVVTVPFQNTSADAVSIQDLRTTCPCLKAELDKMIVPPEGKGILTITYNAAAVPAQKPTLLVQALVAPTMFVLEVPVMLGNE
jgi:hypothetical protein